MFKRYCRKCGDKFQPTGTANYQCPDCREKSYITAKLKRDVTYEKRKKQRGD